MNYRLLLSNGWIGKVVLTCAAIALAPERPAYAALVVVLGFAAGYEWDLYASRRLRGGGAVASRRALLLAADHDPWQVLLCCGLGRIASDPGPVLPGHIQHAESVMADLGYTGDARKRAISWFNSGKQPDCPFSELAERCSAAVDPKAEAALLAAFATQAKVAQDPDQVSAAQATLRDLTGLLHYRNASSLGRGQQFGGHGFDQGLGRLPHHRPRRPGATSNWNPAAMPSRFGWLTVVSFLAVTRTSCHRQPRQRRQALAQRRMVEARAAYEELLAQVGDRP